MAGVKIDLDRSGRATVTGTIEEIQEALARFGNGKATTPANAPAVESQRTRKPMSAAHRAKLSQAAKDRAAASIESKGKAKTKAATT